jgi:hypothetical protein
MSYIRYRIITWQNTHGNGQWRFAIKKFVRVTFKRSGREGWSSEGFVFTGPSLSFDTHAEALTAAKEAKKKLSPPACKK